VTDDEEPSKHSKKSHPSKELHHSRPHHSNSHHSHSRNSSNSHHSHHSHSSRNLHHSNSHHSNNNHQHPHHLHYNNSLVLEYNADFNEVDSILTLPERTHSFVDENDKFSSCSSSDNEEDAPPNGAPLLQRKPSSFVEALSTEFQTFSDDIGTKVEQGFEREEEQEVLRLQVSHYHSFRFQQRIYIYPLI
jgi:hypothetical protein